MPTLPPPGGDIPPYMSFVSEAKAQYEATKKSNQKPLIEPPVLRKIPMPISSKSPPVALAKKPYAKKPPPSLKENQESNPFSMLSGILIPNWFQDQTDVTTAAPQKRKKQPQKIKQMANSKNTAAAGSGSSLPLLPPPKNFPSFENAKRKAAMLKNHKRPQPKRGGMGMPKMKRPAPASKRTPPGPAILPKSTNSKIPIAGFNYADFVKKEFQNPYPTKPPVQLIPHRKQPDSQINAKSPYHNYYPKRHLKIVEKKKGLLEQILSIPEKLPRLPYLSSSVSMQSVDTGNSTTTEISGMYLLNFNIFPMIRVRDML